VPESQWDAHGDNGASIKMARFIMEILDSATRRFNGSSITGGTFHG
jgi:hypothetical protein